jgi:NAD(P)H dehydrogenase (quinone)
MAWRQADRIFRAMAQENIGIIGAGGQTAAYAFEALAERGMPARALIRRAELEADVLAKGASETAVCDFEDRASMEAAFDGLDRLVIVPPSLDPREDEYVRAALAAAERVGVRHVVFHSVLHAYTPTMWHHMRKAAAEAAVRASSMAWTILQPAMYAQSVLMFYRGSPEGSLWAPFSVDKPFTVIDLKDIGEITALVCAGDGHFYAGYELVGDAVRNFHGFAESISAVTGARLDVRTAPPWEMQLPDVVYDRLATFLAMCEEYTGHGLIGNASVTRMLLDREPTQFPEVARRELAALEV